MNRAASTPKPPPPPLFAPACTERTDAGAPSPEVLDAARNATVLRGSGSSMPGAARLLVTAGPGKGGELALGHGIATLGRGGENTLVIADLSVSRRHARIEERAGAWVVIDEGSGNGTRVNGRPAREQRLSDGDEIAVGGTRVQFLEPGGVVARDRPPPESGRARPLRARLMLCAALLLLALALGSGVHRWRELQSRARAVAAREQAHALARQRFQRGVALLGAGQRQQAREDLEVAAELDPSDEEIRRARAAVDRDGAVHAMAQPPPGKPDPAPIQPAGAAPTPEKVVEIAAPRTRSAAPRRRRATPERARNAPGSDADAQAIVAAYRRGDLATARERARESGAPEAARLSAALKDFERACRQAAAQQTPADAVRSLEEAAAADRAIAGTGESKLGGEVRKALSAQHLLAAAALKSDDQLPQAAAHLRAAAGANPSNQPAQAALRRLQEHVRDLYLRGYVVRETEPAEARRCFGLVVQALPAADETAQKAKRWLDKLEGKAAE